MINDPYLPSLPVDLTQLPYSDRAFTAELPRPPTRSLRKCQRRAISGALLMRSTGSEARSLVFSIPARTLVWGLSGNNKHGKCGSRNRASFI